MLYVYLYIFKSIFNIFFDHVAPANCSNTVLLSYENPFGHWDCHPK